MHPTVRYMEWVKTEAPFNRPGVLDCTNSGTPALRTSIADLLDGDIGPLPLTSHEPYGNRELKAAIAFRYGVTPDQVYPAQGTSMANYVLLAAWLNVGDTVLVEAPAYEPLHAAAAALGARVEGFPRREDDGWTLNIERLIERASETDARMIVVTEPHNPSGVWTGDEALLHLAEWVGDDCLVLVDEAYREWGVDRAGSTIACQRANLVSTSSLTKVWGLSRMRCGWVLASEAIIHRVCRAYDHMGVVGPDPFDALAARFLADETRVAALREESVARLVAPRERVAAWLARDSSAHGIVAPDSGFITLRLDGLDRTAYDWLLDEHNVLTTPGRFFGLGDDYVRFTWTSGLDTVERAIARIER